MTVPPKALFAGSVSSIRIFGSDQLVERSPPSSNEFARQAFAIEVRANERLCDHRRHVVISRAINEGITLERGECLCEMIQRPKLGNL